MSELGIAPGTTVTVRVGAIYSGVFDTYSDFFPEPGAPPVSFFVGSRVSAPAPVPASPPQSPAPPDAQAAGTAEP